MRQPFVVSFLFIWICFSPVAPGCNDAGKPATSSIEGAWYKGDLHAHSTHSDGDSSVQEVLSTAESIGLDFFVLTDHDGSMDGLPSQWDDPDYRSNAMILLYGAEWTTGLGHANVWASEPFDYTDLWVSNRNRDARAAIDAAHAQGALFSINHPSAFLCCPWEYEDDEAVDAIEVWNATYLMPNFNYISTSEFWEEHLLAGRRITGLGGSDTHELKAFQSLFLRLAEPTTWIFAAERSADALLEAIRKGRVSISSEPSGPRIELQADLDRDVVFEVMMGDTVLLDEPREILLRIPAQPRRMPLAPRARLWSFRQTRSTTASGRIPLPRCPFYRASWRAGSTWSFSSRTGRSTACGRQLERRPGSISRSGSRRTSRSITGPSCGVAPRRTPYSGDCAGSPWPCPIRSTSAIRNDRPVLQAPLTAIASFSLSHPVESLCCCPDHSLRAAESQSLDKDTSRLLTASNMSWRSWSARSLSGTSPRSNHPGMNPGAS